MSNIYEDISIEKKVFGLYKIWSKIQNEYPNKQKLEHIGWDNLVIQYSNIVSKTRSIKEYYIELMRFVSSINDGHTNVVPPWGFVLPRTTNPPFEVNIIHNKFIITAVGDLEEMSANSLSIGTEILEIDNLDVKECFREINSIYARGSNQANNIINMFYLLSGEIGSTLNLKIKNDDNVEDISMIRKANTPFVHSLTNWDPAITFNNESNHLNIKITTLEDPSIIGLFDNMIESIDEKTTEVTLDLCSNLGGKGNIANHIISRFIDSETKSPIWKYRISSPALSKWGYDEKWEETFTMIQPFIGKRYLGKLNIKCNGGTSSSAEDIAITLKYAGRAKIIGDKTAGSAGNPSSTSLPGGGTLRVSTFIALTPNNEEYIGIGIDTDKE